MGDYEPDTRTLPEQVADVIKNNKLHEEAVWKCLYMLADMIEENKNIRKLANLPKKEYPTELVVNRTHWPIRQKRGE
jgi:hypothetical protein